MSMQTGAQGDIVRLGLGARLTDPASVWPSATVIELDAETVTRLGTEPERALREAIAAQARALPTEIDDVTLKELETGGALVTLARDSSAMRALQVAARRRHTNVAEALQAAVLGLD